MVICANVSEHGSARPVRVAGNRTSHRPIRLHAVFSHLAESGVYGFADAQKFLRNQTSNAIVATDDWILESFRQRTRNGVTERRDQLDPVRTQTWC